MTEPRRICAFYSEGLNFVELLHHVRRRHPAGHIIAMVPAGHRTTEREKSLVNEVVYMELPHYSPVQVRACLRLVNDMRARQFDLFIVRFRSRQLRLLAALSGARHCESWTGDNVIRPLPNTLPRAAWALIEDFAARRLLLWRLRLRAYCTFVRPVKP